MGAVPLSDRGITVCSRRDFLHHPDRYGDIYPHEGVIRASSPVLEEAVEIVSTNLGRVVFSSDDTWCLSAGSSDKRIPPASSFLPNAKVTFIGASNGTRLTHDGAVEKSLSSPVYRDRVANFAVGKAA